MELRLFTRMVYSTGIRTKGEQESNFIDTVGLVQRDGRDNRQIDDQANGQRQRPAYRLMFRYG